MVSIQLPTKLDLTGVILFLEDISIKNYWPDPFI